jgi:error-prone DNA polymerase
MYLNCHSYFSFRYGTLSPQQLVQQAKSMGAQALALTDINNTAAVMPFYEACLQNNIKPIVGMQIRLPNQPVFTVLAHNNKGFESINRAVSSQQMQGYFSNISPAEVKKISASQSNLLRYLLSGEPNAAIVLQWHPNFCKPLKDNEWLGVQLNDLPKLLNYKLPQAYKHKMVFMHPVVHQGFEDYELHKVLRAIDENTVLSKINQDYAAKHNHRFFSRQVLLKQLSAFPFLIENTQRLLSLCSFTMSLGSPKNKKHYTGNPADDRALLFKLAREGFTYRYKASDKVAKQRLESELQVIDKLGFSSYFLINWDIIRYAEMRGFYHVGRGSGANSVVAYCMHITDVDPIELDLYFERFINEKRSSPPDFDIDFSWQQRDEVTEYVFKRFGREHTALLATWNTFNFRSLVRELGKVFGIPSADIDTLALRPTETQMHHWAGQNVFKWAKKLHGFPNYLSIHAGGVLISEQSIFNYTALDLPPKGFPITHFDMHVAEHLGFSKFDILSQRGLGHIKDAVEIVAKNRGERVDIRRVHEFKKDPKITNLLAEGNCLGCFYIESPAMRGLLKKLKCRDYITLVAASSIIRPGVAKSGMMREYIKRFHEPDKVNYIHPVFKEQLGETYGVMVYQEDVLKILHHFADLNLTDADVLRRIMSGKSQKPGEMERIKNTFYSNCKTKNYSPELVNEVWRQVESFCGYSFAKGHSASYAVESFQSLYLKTYYPLEFMVAVLNNFGGFYKTETYVHEARMLGADVQAPCVNNSDWLACIFDKTIYLGFVLVKGLEQQFVQHFLTERNQHGAFTDLADFVSRIKAKKEQIILLIRVGAFRFTGNSVQQLMWQLNAVFITVEPNAANQNSLFASPTEFNLPILDAETDSTFMDQLDLLGFPLIDPFSVVQLPKVNRAIPIVRARDFDRFNREIIQILGYFVARKDLKTSNKKLMSFGTWVDKNGDFFDTVHFPDAFKKYPFRGSGCYHIEGRVTEDFGFYSLELVSMQKLAFKPEKLAVKD